MLAFLACATRPQHRAGLCELLWAETPEPRAALRWCLSRLRPVLDAGGINRVITDGDSLWIDPATCEVDGKRLRELAASAASAGTEELETTVTRLAGPFLSDLEVADAFRFENWRLGEEKSLSQARASVFGELLRRHADSPESQVRVGHLWVQQDPLDSRPHAAVIEALSALGRKREALSHYERCVQMLRNQGGEPDTALENARVSVGRIARVTPGKSAANAAPAGSAKGPAAVEGDEAPAHSRPPLAGRKTELARFDALLDGKEAGKLQLLCGEPGIGKTRLLEEMSEKLGAKGWLRLRGRAFEAERGRAFGPWIDAVAALRDNGDCPLLRSAEGPDSGRLDPDTLHLAMRAWLAKAGKGKPLALILDDVHWLDTASVGLLHYLLRGKEKPFALMLASMRSVAAPMNGPLEALLTHLRREGMVSQWDVGPLDAAETALLLRQAGSKRDPAEIFARSEGHPLSSLALALEGASDDKGSRASLEAMLDERIRMAGDEGRQILQWAALVGRGLSPALLERLMDLSVHDLLNRLDGLETQGLVRVEEGKGGMEYLFGHDLIRQRLRDSLSAPRLARMHAHVAQVLRDHFTLARGWEEIAGHAEAGGETLLAAEACLEGGMHCTRLYAFEQAESLALRGFELAEQAGQWGYIQGLCMLINNVGSSLGRFPEGLDARLLRLAAKARQAAAQEALVWILGGLANMRYLNDQPQAVFEAVMQAESFSQEITEPRLKAYTLADTATCLYATDQELPRARQLVQQAARICQENNLYEPLVDASQAMLAFREARYDDARMYLKRSSPHLGGKDWQIIEHYNFLFWAQVEIESENPVDALALSRKVAALGEWVKQKADFHFPMVIDAMAKRLLGEPDAEALFQAVLIPLRSFNCKVMTSYLLLFWCEQDLAAERTADIDARCREAIERCEPLGRTWEPSWARVLMGLAALRDGRLDQALSHWQALQPAMLSPASLPTRILRRAEELAMGLNLPL